MIEESRSLMLMLDEGFNKGAWHGPNLLGSLRGVTVRQLLHRPRKDGHNIWELALHCAYWKSVARDRLTGRRGSFPLEGSNFFPRGNGLSLSDWKRDLALLKSQHALLKGTILKLDPAKYGARIAGSRHTVRRTILGAAAHDIYHAGQISLLRRMVS
jgi:hypothetical protein